MGQRVPRMDFDENLTPVLINSDASNHENFTNQSNSLSNVLPSDTTRMEFRRGDPPWDDYQIAMQAYQANQATSQLQSAMVVDHHNDTNPASITIPMTFEPPFEPIVNQATSQLQPPFEPIVNQATSQLQPGGGTGYTPTTLVSPGNTFSVSGYSKTTPACEEPDSVSLKSLACENDQIGNEEEGKRGTAVSAKRTRAAKHNHSERTDKASMLDEVIQHLKKLQDQVRMLNNLNMTSRTMMLPLAPHQQQLQQLYQLQMSMMAGMGMGLPDTSNIGPATAPVPPPIAPATTAFNPPPPPPPAKQSLSDPLLLYLTGESRVQPMDADAYRRMENMFQQCQTSGSGSGSG
ncbi:transcription factor une10 [Phtheirospermum japonicum]|uniref:Transcription factor une10 n=1 Tax=Phtheirospermum japonicum TaxID=374723 RepID=A0A830B8W3_9LAMI|nr:transcription factor une10 [Phtheirospermum japonicum]